MNLQNLIRIELFHFAYGLTVFRAPSSMNDYWVHPVVHVFQVICQCMQVNAVGDLCAICQEKMHAPILLRCKHIFCEDCASEW